MCTLQTVTLKVGRCCASAKSQAEAKCLYVFLSFPQIEATLVRSAEYDEVQRVAECCWHLARRTSEPRRRLWQGHCRKHKWEMMAPLFRVICRAPHHSIWGRCCWVQLTTCTNVHKGGGQRCKKQGKNRVQLNIIKTQASVSPHNVMVEYNWCIFCFLPGKKSFFFFSGLHRHAHFCLRA